MENIIKTIKQDKISFITFIKDCWVTGRNHENDEIQEEIAYLEKQQDTAYIMNLEATVTTATKIRKAKSNIKGLKDKNEVKDNRNKKTNIVKGKVKGKEKEKELNEIDDNDLML